IRGTVRFPFGVAAREAGWAESLCENNSGARWVFTPLLRAPQLRPVVLHSVRWTPILVHSRIRNNAVELEQEPDHFIGQHVRLTFEVSVWDNYVLLYPVRNFVPQCRVLALILWAAPWHKGFLLIVFSFDPVSDVHGFDRRGGFGRSLLDLPQQRSHGFRC